MAFRQTDQELLKRAPASGSEILDAIADEASTDWIALLQQIGRQRTRENITGRKLRIGSRR